MALAAGLLWDIDGAVAEPSSVIGTTRRPNGELTNNVIDYLLASKNLIFTARTQLKGVADHDLVFYHLITNDPVTCFKWPQHSLLKEVSVSDELWNSLWVPAKEVFNSCLQLKDANGAWAILSFTAEQCLGASEHASKPRHACLKPQPKLSQFGAKHPAFQSLLERRLRRLARRADQALVQPWNEPLQVNLRRNISQLAVQCPELLDITWSSANAASSILNLADKVAVDNAEVRAAEWENAIAFDFHRLSEWIKSDVAEDRPVPYNASSPHPQLQVQEAAEKWDALWNPPVLPQIDAFDNLSPYLFWCTVAGLSCHPAAVLDVEALQQEWRRQYSLNAGMPVPARASSHSTAVLNKLGWEISRNGMWKTPYGQIRPGWLTHAIFRRLVRLSWARCLYDDDRKTTNPLPQTREPYLGFHDSLVLEGGPVYKLRVAIAAASDARVLARRGIDAPCSCGERCPDRTHLTFSCPDTIQPPSSRSSDEDRLLVPLVPLPNVSPLQELQPVPNLVLYLQSQFAESGCPVVLGLDGSCLVSSNNSLWQCASWAVVGLHNAISVNGRVDGADQSPAAAERTALVQALEAAHTAQVPVRLLIDNLAIVQRLTRGLDHNSWNGDAPGFWSHVASRVAFGVQAMWVPSHGKQPNWVPSFDWGLTIQDCRSLNAAADEAAGAVTDLCLPVFQGWCSSLTSAHSWAAHAFAVQWHRTQPYHDQLCQDMTTPL
eukprot:Skav235641  [mRNA]  locus=scaffold358:529290:532652:- [translate_table: standard]